MRQIQFRGKRVTDGKWVYGYLTNLLHDHATGKPIAKIYHEWFEVGEQSVSLETVGQYTDVEDKNYKKIFEGDIVNIKGNPFDEDVKSIDYNAQIVFKDGGFCAINGTKHNYGYANYVLSCSDYTLEVIGNVFDNPELLLDNNS